MAFYLFGRLRDAAQKLFERVPEEKRHFVIVIASGALALALLIFSGASLLMNKTGKEKNSPETVIQRLPIPPEEIFWPEEPDYVPGVLLERERRTVWTREDAAPYWQDPLKNGEEQWRKRVETAVDELLERVP